MEKNSRAHSPGEHLKNVKLNMAFKRLGIQVKASEKFHPCFCSPSVSNEALQL